MADIEIGPDGSPIIKPKIPSDTEFKAPDLPVNPNPVTPFSPSVTPTPTSGNPHKSLPPTPKVPTAIAPPKTPTSPTPTTSIPGFKPSLPPIAIKKGVNTTDLMRILLTHGMDTQQAGHAIKEIQKLLE